MGKQGDVNPSLWAATAEPAPPTPALTESVAADVAVVGAGYAGLSAALHLAEGGASVVALEAAEPGWGGSGRNGGQVIPGLKWDPDELESMLGPEAGARLVDFAGRTAEGVFDLVAKHEIACHPVRRGWVQTAHTPAALETVRRRAEQWQKRGAPLALLDRAATAEHLGTDAYLGGWIDRRAGGIQPLSYTRGLVRAALAAGAKVHGETPVTALRRAGSHWELQTQAGPVVGAERVLLCTNGYTGDLWPRLKETVIAANSFQVATAPLSDNVRRSILPHGQVCSDTRRLLLYFRLDHTGCFVMGGRGPFRDPEGPADFAHLKRMTERLFPQLGGVAYEFGWAGRVALTRDFLPHLHEPAPGLIATLGCNGRGVGLATSMGMVLADYVLKQDRRVLPFPATPIRPIPFHGLHRLYVGATVAYYRLRDAIGT